MKVSVRSGFVVLALAAMVLAGGGCYHLAVNGSQLTPSNPSGPSTAPSTTPTGGPCNSTQAPGATIVPMAFAFASSGAPSPSPYGAVNGYGPPNFFVPPSGSFTVPTPLPIQIASGTTVQFENLEADFNSPQTVHSAAFVSTTSFTANYTFPSSQQKASGSSIGGAASWSTGPIPATNGTSTCYSQTFRISGGPGTVYFGDLKYYNTSNFRSVFIIK
jgi:hypothetical protein